MFKTINDIAAVCKRNGLVFKITQDHVGADSELIVSHNADFSGCPVWRSGIVELPHSMSQARYYLTMGGCGRKLAWRRFILSCENRQAVQ